MSFDITVTPLSGLHLEMPEEDSLLDVWFEQSKKMWLYDSFLGGVGTVGEYWCSPAKRLGLPFLARIYQDGLKVSATEELEQLSKELDTLEAHWHTLKFPEWPPNFLEFRLLEPMGYFREALCVALEHRAVLIVS